MGRKMIYLDDAIDAVMNTEPRFFDFDTLEPCQKTKDVVKAINNLPSAQLEQKTGKWYIDAGGNVRCAVCKTKCLRDDIGVNILSNYCPSCGVDMRGEKDDK